MTEFWDLDEEPAPAVAVAEEVSATPGTPIGTTPIPLEPGASLVVAPKPEASLARKNDVTERLRGMESEILAKSLEIIDSAEDFHKAMNLDGTLATEVPQAWIAQYGQEGAEQRFKIARAACMSAKDAPVALKMAQQTAVGAMAALEKAKAGPAVFNLQFVQMVQPAAYAEIEIVESE